MAVEAYFDAETIWVSEIDKYASQVIQAHDDLPNLGDLKKIKWDEVEPIDILTAGYPCQPFSTAGSRKGTDDERHIWPYILEAISVLRPSFIILENVAGHLSLGFGDVLSNLAQIGYDARWEIVRASEVGAPHQRKRLFTIAYPKGGRSGSQSIGVSESDTRISGNCKSVTDTHKFNWGISSSNQTSTHAISKGSQRSRWKERRYRSSSYMARQEVPNTLDSHGRLNAKFVEYMMGLPVGWVTDCGLSRTQQLKILGNGVVPQQAFYALELLIGVSPCEAS